MYIISLMNFKGGVGKTTIALNLSATLANQGQRVVLIDADPQQSATQWAQQDQTADSTAPAALSVAVHPLQAGVGAPQFQAALAHLAQTAQATLVVIDCPSELADPALVAALLSDIVLVPVTPSPLDLILQHPLVGLESLELLVRVMRCVTRDLMDELSDLGFVPCRLLLELRRLLCGLPSGGFELLGGVVVAVP